MTSDRTTSASLTDIIGRAPTAQSFDELVQALAVSLRADAVQLVGWDRTHHEHVSLISHGYSGTVSNHLCVGMMDAELFGLVRSEQRPLSIDGDDTHVDFRQSWHFQEVLGPAGFDDGLSAALTSPDGRYSGMLHASSARRHHFDSDDRWLVAELSPHLSDMVDAHLGGPTHHRGSTVLFDPSGAIVQSTTRLPVDPKELRRLAGAFLRSGVASMRFLATDDTQWYRMHLTTTTTEQGPAAELVAAPVSLPAHLTSREITVLTHIALGDSNRRIAHDLGVSIRTVTTHVDHVLEKLGCESRAGAAGRAVRDGLLVPTLGAELDRVGRFMLGAEQAGPLMSTYVHG